MAIVVACCLGRASLVAAEPSKAWIQPTRGLEWMFFPTNPPVLGAEIAEGVTARVAADTPVLRSFLTEPFYAPIAARIIYVEGEQPRDPLFDTEEYVHLDSFLSLRAALVRELYNRADSLLRLAPRQRRAAFAALASAQEARFAEMEATAEWLRDRLARAESWNEHRRWRLNRGDLKQPREKTYVLEFQVVRAAAYYQAGLSPAQRRLVRELAIEMSERIATRGQGGDLGRLLLFSPETTRILRPEGASAELDTMIDAYLAEKRRLKDELQALIYETDSTMLETTRVRRFEELAQAQAGAIDHVETLAELIREEITRLPDYRRFRGGARLSTTMVERLEVFAASARQIEADRTAFLRRRAVQAREKAANDPSGTPVRESPAQARAAFELDQGDRLLAHDREAEKIVAELIEELPPEEAMRLNGAPDIALRDFLARRSEQEAYVDYDLAALEPGLSPAQRRLLLASAMLQLRQVMLPPELQPTKPPGTLLGIGE